MIYGVFAAQYIKPPLPANLPGCCRCRWESVRWAGTVQWPYYEPQHVQKETQTSAGQPRLMTHTPPCALTSHTHQHTHIMHKQILLKINYMCSTQIWQKIPENYSNGIVKHNETHAQHHRQMNTTSEYNPNAMLKERLNLSLYLVRCQFGKKILSGILFEKEKPKTNF